MYNPQPKPIKLEIDRTKGKCKQCGKEFELFRSYRSICSYDCGKKYDAVRGKVKKATPNENKANIKKEIERRLTNDKLATKAIKTLKKKQKDRHGFNFCERCGKSGVMISGHHIIFCSEASQSEHIHDERNLILVCGTDCTGCHGYYHAVKSNREPLIEQRNLTELFGTQILSKKI
jgi:hypothetical protein